MSLVNLLSSEINFVDTHHPAFNNLFLFRIVISIRLLLVTNINFDTFNNFVCLLGQAFFRQIA